MRTVRGGRPDLVSTGITGLDRILHGGVVRGSVVLVEGGPGTGKSTLGMEFVYRGAAELDEPGVLVLFDVAPERAARAAAGFGWDLAGLERARRLKIVFTTRRIFEQEVQQADSLLLEEARAIGARRLFVDGVAVTVHGHLDSVRDRFHALAGALQREGLTTLVALGTPAGVVTRPAAPAAELVADAIVVLRTEPELRGVTRTLEVVKARGQEVDLGRHSMRIVPARGVEVYRRARAGLYGGPVAAGYDPTVRVPTGIPGVDELINGGLYRASATLLAGASGTGKSVAALQFLVEGARRGERGLLVDVEEPASQVLASAAAIGLDLQAACDRDLVRIWCPTPEELEVDPHFHGFEQHVAGFRPHRVVIDSLSAYGASLDAENRTLRHLLHAMVAVLKANQATSVCLFETPRLLGSSITELLVVSTLFDNIVRLHFVELGGTVRLAVTAAKLRGNPSTYIPRACEFVHGVGLRVLADPAVGTGPRV